MRTQTPPHVSGWHTWAIGANIPHALADKLAAAEIAEQEAYVAWDAIAAESILTRSEAEEQVAYRFWEDAITATNAAYDAALAADADAYD